MRRFTLQCLYNADGGLRDQQAESDTHTHTQSCHTHVDASPIVATSAYCALIKNRSTAIC